MPIKIKLPANYAEIRQMLRKPTPSAPKVKRGKPAAPRAAHRLTVSAKAQPQRASVATKRAEAFGKRQAPK